MRRLEQAFNVSLSWHTPFSACSCRTPPPCNKTGMRPPSRRLGNSDDRELPWRQLDISMVLCHTKWMTTRGRLNARLEPELERKLAYLRQRTGLATSDVVRASIERFYEAMRAGGQQARAILEESGFIGSGSGPANLSARYKEELNESLSKKHQ